MTAKQRSLMLLFSLLGLGASIVSSYVHYKLLTDPTYVSICDVNASVSCTQAYLSRYGSFMGIPVALGGVIFFAVAAALAGVAGSRTSRARDNAPGYIFLWSTIGLAFVMYLAWASYVVLGVFCIFCAITYVSVIALFIISGGATKYPMTSIPSRAGRDLRALVSSPVALALALVIGVGGAVLIASFPSESSARAAQQEAYATYQPLTPEQRAQLEAWWAVQPTVDIPVQRSEGTRVLIVKFSDYQCPGCRSAFEALRPVLAKYEGQPVEFVKKHYPLEPECNPGIQMGVPHYGSCEAAAAYEMAKGTPHLDKLDKWLFDNQQTLTKDSVRRAAEEIAGIADYDTRYEATLETVRADAALGKRLNVRSTPTIYINGKMLNPSIMPPAYYDTLIELELKKAQ